MSVIEKILKNAMKDKQTIVLPESHDPRVIQASIWAAKKGIANVILIGDQKKVQEALAGFKSENISILDPSFSNKTVEYAALLYETRKEKGMTKKQADELIKNTLYFGAVMVKIGDADGMVTGASTSSSDVLRAALQIVKSKPGVSNVSSCQIMDLSENPFVDADAWALADCVVNINPDAQQLAIIAVRTAETYKQLLDTEPKVAMLSFSTNGSAKHEFVDKVVEALKLAQAAAPDLLIDGEMQLDAAIIRGVAQTKCPDSPIAGEANVLIFPDIQSGNIGYKLVERVGGAKLVGCIIQGLNRPINDLSRGCEAEDILNAIAITAVQAQGNK